MHKYVKIVILCIGAFFLFYNLNHHYLWKDEAEKALLARSVVEKGIPLRNIGKNQIQIHVPQYLRNGEIWTFHPWLQFYVTALSFKLFGESTWSARFPFAIFGFLSLILMYLLALRLSRDKTIALLALSLLTFLIPFILNMRECRYYAPGVFFSLLLFLFYLNFLERKKYAFFGYLITANLLFHSSYGYFIPINVGIIAHYGVRSRRDLTPFILLQSLVFLTTFPAVMYYNGIQHGSRGLEWIRISHNLQYYFRVIHKFMFPLFLMVGVLLADLLFWKKKIWIQMKSYLSSSTLGLIGIVTLSTFFFGAMGDQHYYRYILHLVPLFLIVTAVFFKATFLYSKWISKIGFILVLMTSLLHYSVFNVFSKKNISYFPPIDYVYELTHPHDDLSKGLVEFFNKHAKPTDTIGIPYADHQLMFYTDFRILNINIKKNVFPEWIVYQSSWFGDVYGPSEKSDYFKAIQNQYERIETNIPDVRWSYRADPYHYQFRNHKDVPRLVIFKKKI